MAKSVRCARPGPTFQDYVASRELQEEIRVFRWATLETRRLLAPRLSSLSVRDSDQKSNSDQ